MDEQLVPRMLQAVRSNQPFNLLQKIAIELRDRGLRQEEVKTIFTEFLNVLTTHGAENEGDIVRDVLDVIVGWCSPDQRLYM